MTHKVQTTRRTMMTGVAGLLLSQSLQSAFAASAAKQGPAADKPSSPAAFRAAGGEVAVYFFGAWTQFGQSRNPAPWYWINHGYQERLPTRSVALPGHWLGWSFDENDTSYTPVGQPGSARATDARLTQQGNAMRFEPAGPRSAIRSPDFHAGQGSDFPAVRFHVQRGAAKAWQCALTFTTWGDPPRTGRVAVAEPQWSDTPTAILVDMSANEEWMKGEIRNFAIEIGVAGRGDYTLHGRLELVPSAALAKELAGLQGLPQDQQWAADWQQSEAQAHGVNIFSMCTYWDGEKSFNEPVIDAMFASKAAPNLKLGLYFDSLAGRRPQTLTEFDALLRYWNRYFANPRYWRIGGRPVLTWHGGETTRDYLSAVPEFKDMPAQQRLTAMVRYMQDFFRKGSDSNAHSGLYLVASFLVDAPYWAGSGLGKAGLWDQAGFDAGTVYNQFESISSSPDAARVPAPGGAQTFAELDEVYRQSADWIRANSGNRIRYFMPAIAGWDVRPWAKIAPRKSPPCGPTWDCIPNQAQFKQHLAGVRDRAVAAASGFSAPPGPVVMIDAWDEFGEGGFICPTRGYGSTRLEAVRDTFGVKT